MMSEIQNNDKSEDLTVKKDDERLWKEYQVHIDIFKYYLDLLLKFNIFYYASTGGILSFFFTQTDKKFVEYALLFPILVSFSFGVLFMHAAKEFKLTQKNMSALRSELNIHTGREFDVIIILLKTSALLMFGVAIVVFILFLLTFFLNFKQ